MTAALGLACGLVLAATFAVSAVTKWRAPSETEATLRSFGIPRPVMARRALPLTEAALALLLVIMTPAGGFLAVGLLVLFTALLADQLRRGNRSPCRCFGAMSAGELGLGHLVRNLVLLLLAVAATGAPSVLV